MSDDRWAVIARADRGGIAAQSLEIARHAGAHRALIVDLGAGGRGPSDPTLFDFVPERRVCLGYPRHTDIEWLAQGVRSVFSVEGIYGAAARETLAALGTRLVLQANPELFAADDLAGTNLEVVAPTAWRLDLLPPATPVLPVPIDTIRLHPEPRQGGPLRLGHMTGAAMLDRNGTLPLFGALRRFDMPDLEVMIAGQPFPERRWRSRDPRLRQWPDVGCYLERWDQPRPDLLVQPRRYGGLALPCQEAAACGVPVVMPRLSPQVEWPLTLFDATAGRDHPMKGGLVHVADPEPAVLAEMLQELISTPQRLQEEGERARAWAESLSWEHWVDHYRALLLR